MTTNNKHSTDNLLSPIEQQIKQMLGGVEDQPGVTGVIIFENLHAQIIYTTMVDRNVAQRYAQCASKLCQVASEGLSEVSERDKLKILRMRTNEHELVIKPEENFTLVVLQDSTGLSK